MPSRKLRFVGGAHRATLIAAIAAVGLAATARAQAPAASGCQPGSCGPSGCGPTEPVNPVDVNNFPPQLALVQAQGAAAKAPYCDAAPHGACVVDANCPGPDPNPGVEGDLCIHPDDYQANVITVLQKNPLPKIQNIDDCDDAVTEINIDFALKNHDCIDVAIYGHGSPGSMKVGEDVLEPDDPTDPTECIDKINGLAGKICSLTLVGCSVASGPAGQQLLQELFQGLGVPIKAWTEPIWSYPKVYAADPPRANRILVEDGSKKKTPIKTWPLAESQNFWIRIENRIPFAPAWAGYAGAILKLHILDNQELDVTGFHPREQYRMHVSTMAIPGPLPASMNVPSPFGPPSANLQSVPISLTFWNAKAQTSGVPVMASQSIPVATLDLHAKSTSTTNNSDTDLTFEAWNIWHILSTTASTTLVRLEASDKIWVTSSITDPSQLHTTMSVYRFPSGPEAPTPFYPNAHWLHLTQPATFHLSSGPGSAFYATFLNQVGLGIEHVPEPARDLLIGSGILGLALGGRLRQRRRRRMA